MVEAYLFTNNAIISGLTRIDHFRDDKGGLTLVIKTIRMAINKLHKDILLITFMAYGFLNFGYCQLPGSRFNALRTNFRRPVSITHGRSRRLNSLSPLPRGNNNNHIPTTNFHGTNNGGARINNIEGIRGRLVPPHFQQNGQRHLDSRLNSRTRFNQASSNAFTRQNNVPNRTIYATINNGGRSNQQARSFVPVTVQNIQNVRSQNPTRSGTLPARRNHQSIVRNRRIPPSSNGPLMNGGPRSRNRPMSSFQGRSRGHGTPFHTQATQHVPRRAYPSSVVNPVSRRQSIVRPLQASALSNTGLLNTQVSTGSRSNIYQSQLSENRIDPRYRFRGVRNEASQHGTLITRAPSSNRFVSRDFFNQRQSSGNPVQPLTLPFERLSLRYPNFRDSERKKSVRTTNLNGTNVGQNINSRQLQTGVQRRRSPVHTGDGPSQQTGLPFRGNSIQHRSLINGARFRTPLQSVGVSGQRQRAINTNRRMAYRNRNAPSTGRSLQDILGISTRGLQEAARNDMPEMTRTTQMRHSRPLPNVQDNSQSPPRKRVGTQPYVELGRNSNDQTKANLIADIRRTLNIAERLNLFRKRYFRNNRGENMLSGRQTRFNAPTSSVMVPGRQSNKEDVGMRDLGNGLIENEDDDDDDDDENNVLISS